MPEEEKKVRHYYLDEAGCPTIFASRGKVIIGEQGCSNFFMLGFVDVKQPKIVADGINTLRKDILSDPYFKDIPSMNPARKKTAVLFHAKDDIAEVRREVFKYILGCDFTFHAEIRSKISVHNEIIAKQSKAKLFKYTENYLYDSLTSRLLKNHLHKGDIVNICFAKRGSKPRTGSFNKSIDLAKQNFEKKWGIVNSAEIVTRCSTPAETACLQVTDYCLWALQRLYERNEARYIESIWGKVGSIHDIDDRRTSKAGAYYTKQKPLEKAVLRERYRVSPTKSDHTA